MLVGGRLSVFLTGGDRDVPFLRLSDKLADPIEDGRRGRAAVAFNSGRGAGLDRLPVVERLPVGNAREHPAELGEDFGPVVL